MSKVKPKVPVLLFVSKQSHLFDYITEEFTKLVSRLAPCGLFACQTIEIKKRSDLAEKHKIIALPTLIVGKKRIIGCFKTDQIINLLHKDGYKI